MLDSDDELPNQLRDLAKIQKQAFKRCKISKDNIEGKSAFSLIRRSFYSKRTRFEKGKDYIKKRKKFLSTLVK